MLYPEIPVDAKVDYGKSEFYGSPPTMYLIARRFGPDGELHIDTAFGYFLDPYVATDEVRRRYDRHDDQPPVLIVPVNPFGETPSFKLKPWAVERRS